MKKVILVAIALACNDAPEPAPAPASAPTPVPAPAPSAHNEFDPFTVKVGDTINGVQLAEIDVQMALDSLPSGRATFIGEIQLTGDYRPHFDYPEVNEACFWPDSASGKALPRMKGDSRTQAWFCFRNQEVARRLLGSPGAAVKTTIVVDSFTTHVARSDVWNEAKLVRAVE